MYILYLGDNNIFDIEVIVNFQTNKIKIPDIVVVIGNGRRVGGYDRRMSNTLKRQICIAMVRHALIYGSDTWSI